MPNKARLRCPRHSAAASHSEHVPTNHFFYYTMADQVEAVLDRMVPALRDLLDRGIFAESEIHAIVTRRRESEYLIRRRDCRKTDFSRYIEAEQNLEKLRRLRSKKIFKLNEQSKHTSRSSKPTLPSSRSSPMADASIIQHIHYLYSRAKRKWKGDLTWHLQHVDFAKKAKSLNMLGKIYAEALQLHPRCVHLWIESASHEYFGYIVDTHTPGMSGGGSIRNARVLLQRGLRINPTSEDLWLQSFHLELHYVQKLRGRRHILQPGWDKEDTKSLVVESTKNSEEGKEDMEEALYDSLLPLIVYKNAIKAIPQIVSFRLRFLDLCAKFPDTDSIEREIRSSIERDCSDSVEAWMAQASHLLLDSGTRRNANESDVEEGDSSDDGDGDDDEVVDEDVRKRKLEDIHDNSSGDWDIVGPKLIHIFQEATDRINSNEMYLHAIRFLEDIIKNRALDDNDMLVAAVESLFRKSIHKRIESSALILEHAKWLVGRGKLHDADQSLYKTMMIDKRFVTDAQLWIYWAEVAGKGSSHTKHQTQHSPEYILQCALELIPMHNKGHFDVASTLFLHQLQTLGSNNKTSTTIHSLTTLFDKLLLLSAQAVSTTSDDDMPSRMLNICATYLHHALAVHDTEFIRGIYSRIFYSSSFLKNCRIGGDDDSIEKIQFLFDASISREQELVNKDRKGSKSVSSVQSRRIVDTAVAFFEGKGITKLARFYKNQFNS